jgi:transketolase
LKEGDDMNVKINKEILKDKKMMRDVYAATLIELANQDENVVVLDADLMSSMGMKAFQKAHPERTFNCGIQEADMAGIAAGLSATGKIPYAHTFGPFATRRCCDQIFVSCAYAKLNVRMVGSDPGITAAFNGGTHMPFEDMGIMRGIPEVTVIEPVDNAMLKDILTQLKDKYGVFYIRLQRKEPYAIYEEGSTFDIGKGITLRDGTDVTLIASGVLVADALKAADILKEKGVSARVVNLFTWKPIDADLIAKCARETGAIVTVENHNIVNGLASAVSEVLTSTVPVPVEKIGCQDRFGEVGPQDYLQKVFKMTAEDIVEKALAVLKRK